MTTDLFPDDRPRQRTPAQPATVPWTCDATVPLGIREQARSLGARACRLIRHQVVVVLADGRAVYLNLRGEQTGHATDGLPAPIWDDVPWPLASSTERTYAA